MGVGVEVRPLLGNWGTNMRTFLWKSLCTAACLSGLAGALGGCAVADDVGFEEDEQKQCAGDPAAEHVLTVDEACHGTPANPSLAGAHELLCTLLTGTGPLTEDDGKNLLKAIQAGTNNSGAAGYYVLEETKPPWFAATVEKNRQAWQLLTEGRRALALMPERSTPEFEKALPLAHGMVTAVPRKVVPDDARVSTEAFAQEQLVAYNGPELLRDPSQWTPWLDYDHDGWVTGVEYNAWGSTHRSGFEVQIGVRLPYQRLYDLGLQKSVIPLGFKAIEKALACRKTTPAAPSPLFRAVYAPRLKVLQRRPEAVVDGVAFFRNYMSVQGDYTNALMVNGGAPSPLKGGVAVNSHEFYPLNFSYFSMDGVMHYLDRGGVHRWNAATSHWELAIARVLAEGESEWQANSHAAEDNGGFLAGRRVFQFRQYPIGGVYKLALEYYDFDDRQHHRVPGLIVAGKSPQTNVVVMGTKAFVQFEGEAPIRAFDTTSFAWTELPAAPIEQRFSLLVGHKGRLLRMGGMKTVTVDGQLKLYPTREIMAYDPAANAWQPAGTTPRLFNNRLCKTYPAGHTTLISGRLHTDALELVTAISGYAYEMR
jgi:hypothetical protein